MKTLLSIQCVLLAISTMAFGAEPTTTTLSGNAGAVMVSVSSSEPPITKDFNTKKPEWINKADENKPILALNNVWYPLEHRMRDGIRAGGWGDQHEVFFRFPLPKEGTEFERATLRLYVRQGNEPLPKKLEIRKVTSSDPLPINEAKGSWAPERIRYVARPSSEYFTSVETKAGWIEIDVTELVKGWIGDAASNQGIHICATQHRNHWAHFNGPDAKENAPQLVLSTKQ